MISNPGLPTQTENLHSRRAAILTFIDEGAYAAISFCICPGNLSIIVLPRPSGGPSIEPNLRPPVIDHSLLLHGLKFSSLFVHYLPLFKACAW